MIPGWEDPLEKGKVTHSRILAWRVPWTVENLPQSVGRLWEILWRISIVHGVAKSQTRLSDFHSLTHGVIGFVIDQH